MTQPQQFWYDGELIEADQIALPIDQPGLLYGATVFTTLRVYGDLEHPLTQWQEHCDRMQASVQHFGWQPPNWPRLQAGASQLSQRFSVLRITLFPNGREWITGRHLPPHLKQWQQQGITAWLAKSADLRRSLPAHKTGNYLPAWMARQTAQQQGAEEAILANEDSWLETSTGNLWGWRDGRWWTPPLSAGILPGIVRSQLISWLRCQNEDTQEKPWRDDLVSGFEAIAYTNSVVEVIPIHTVLKPSGRLVYNPNHEEFQRLRAWFQLSPTLQS